MKESETWLDSQLWHACAGGMVQMPPVNSEVYYLPQGHAEHAQNEVNFAGCPKIPAQILCRISDVKFMADPVIDEVFAKIHLVPINPGEPDGHEILDDNSLDVSDKPLSFAKTLTQSDANNGGGFSVPRYCAETIFPPLDYSHNPPVQTVVVKDVHGVVWKFRHIYRGTPRRHLLTTGWNNFVSQKNIVAGDSVVFLKEGSGVLRIGIRRANKGIGDSPGFPAMWNSSSGKCMLLRYDEFSSFLGSGGRRSWGVTDTSVIEAAVLAATGKPFEIVYYPRLGTPEFCVRASLVREAMKNQWCAGMRFKMAFETEDSSRISWFMGTISSIQAMDPIRWPNSLWRLLEVTWDEPDLLQNVKRVSPWLVELAPSFSTTLLPSFMPMKKKLRVSQPSDFILNNQIPYPLFSHPLALSSGSLCYPTDSAPADIQGARHAQFGQSLSSHLRELESNLFPVGFNHHDHTNSSSRVNPFHQNMSCLLPANDPSRNLKKQSDTKAPHFLLFGQPILTEEQLSWTCSEDAPSLVTGNSPSHGNGENASSLSDGSGSVICRPNSAEDSSTNRLPWLKGCHVSEASPECGHCSSQANNELQFFPSLEMSRSVTSFKSHVG